MKSFFAKLLVDMDKNLFFCFAIFAILGVITAKIIDKILDRDRIKNKYFRNENNRVSLGILLTGFIQLLTGALIAVIYKVLIPWLVLSICIIIAGILGMIPFSFFNKAPGYYKNRMKNKARKLKGHDT